MGLKQVGAGSVDFELVDQKMWEGLKKQLGRL